MNAALANRPHVRAPAPQVLKRVLGLALIVLSFTLAAAVIANKHTIDSLLAGAGIGAYPIAVAVFAIVAAAPFSVTDALAVSNGVLFGPFVGSLVNAIGLVLGALLSYQVARRTSSLLDIDSQIGHLPPWVNRFRVGSPVFLILVRIIPGVGGTLATQILATQIAAALQVPLLRHVVTFCIVTIPFCTLLAFGGNAISTYVERHIVVPAEGYATRHHLHFGPRQILVQPRTPAF
jgi:uncharacterized membrane protein YdjX (TVP38/TMEM64 family)